MSRAPLVLALASVVLMAGSALVVAAVAECGTDSAGVVQFQTPGVYLVSLSTFNDELRSAIGDANPSCS